MFLTRSSSDLRTLKVAEESVCLLKFFGFVVLVVVSCACFTLFKETTKKKPLESLMFINR